MIILSILYHHITISTQETFFHIFHQKNIEKMLPEYYIHMCLFIITSLSVLHTHMSQRCSVSLPVSYRSLLVHFSSFAVLGYCNTSVSVAQLQLSVVARTVVARTVEARTVVVRTVVARTVEVRTAGEL